MSAAFCTLHSTVFLKSKCFDVKNWRTFRRSPVEGTNNKIKTMKRQAYGYRDNEFFKLKIMAIHLAKYALVG